MDETGDQFANNITEDLKSLDINSNASNILDVIEEIKDKCEALVNDRHNLDESSDILPEGLLSKRDNDSEADIEEEDNNVFNGDKDERKEQWINESDEPIDDRIKVSVVTSEGNDEKASTTELTLHPQRNRHLKPRTEKWGESVGIVDENGRNRRVISLTELSNYMILEVWGQKTDSKIYCSLINSRYPRFLDSTIDCNYG